MVVYCWGLYNLCKTDSFGNGWDAQRWRDACVDVECWGWWEGCRRMCVELVLREKKGRLRKGKRGGWKLLVFPLVLLATLDLGADEFFDHVL